MLIQEKASQYGRKIAEQMPLLRELNDCKRLYSYNLRGKSFTSLIFSGATKPLFTGQPLESAMWTAGIVVSARLGAITSDILTDIGIDEGDRLAILKESISIHQSLSKEILRSLTDACVKLEKVCIEDSVAELEWVKNLDLCPRAGATCPGKPRIALEPAEMHSDHCAMVAAYGYLLADTFGANREDAWLIGLCHHLHNAYMPDAGFTGETLLGDHLEKTINFLRNRALTTFSKVYQDKVINLFKEIENIDSPLAQTFHAADTIDRVVQLEHYERTAKFRVSVALEDFNLVHEGSAQEFQHALLQSIGISYNLNNEPSLV